MFRAVAAHPGGKQEVIGGHAGVGRSQPDAAGAAALRALPPLGCPLLHQGAAYDPQKMFFSLPNLLD